MTTVIVISVVAVLAAIVGSIAIWGFDAHRAEEVSGDGKRRDVESKPSLRGPEAAPPTDVPPTPRA